MLADSVPITSSKQRSKQLPVIRVFEYEKLTINVDNKGRYLTKHQLGKLYQFNDNNKNIYFTGIRNGVKFNQYVGVIQIGSLTIEILPKADNNKYSEEEDYSNWRSALLKMLGYCKKIKLGSVSEANLQRRNHSILDLYFEIFLDEVDFLIRNGLVKKYSRTSGNVKALKGSLNFAKQIQNNLIHQERFYTNHQVYNQDHLINQILFKALLVLKQISSNSSFVDRIERLKMNFPEVKLINVKASHFDQIVINRKTAKYAKAIQIAKMIILKYSPDIKSGQENMMALLFDMNKLWEEYIYRMLLRSKTDDLNISFQNKKYFWEKRKIKPDLVIEKKQSLGQEKITYVVDTKWKILSVNNPQPSDDDLKQMYAYNMYWGAKRSMLLYPNSKNINEKFGNYLMGRANPEDNQCKVGFINVLDAEGGLDLNIGTKILQKFI